MKHNTLSGKCQTDFYELYVLCIYALYVYDMYESMIVQLYLRYQNGHFIIIIIINIIRILNIHRVWSNFCISSGWAA